MKARLRRVCKSCTESSLQTYYYNIKALAKIAGHDEPPGNHKWINKALLAKIRNTDESLISNVWTFSRGMRDTRGYWQEFGKRGRRRPA